jgi:hypothetical protein
LIRHGEVHVLSGDGSSLGLAEGSAFGECVDSWSASTHGRVRRLMECVESWSA